MQTHIRNGTETSFFFFLERLLASGPHERRLGARELVGRPGPQLLCAGPSLLVGRMGRITKSARAAVRAASISGKNRKLTVRQAPDEPRNKARRTHLVKRPNISGLSWAKVKNHLSLPIGNS